MSRKGRILTLSFALAVAVIGTSGTVVARDDAVGAVTPAALDEHERHALVVIDEKAAYGAALDEHERRADALPRERIASEIPGM